MALFSCTSSGISRTLLQTGKVVLPMYLSPALTVMFSGRIKEAYPALSILPLLPLSVYTDGLSLNLVHDIAQYQTAVVNVSAVLFNVDCQALSNATQTGPARFNTSSGLVEYPFHLHPTLQDVRISPGQIILGYCTI